MVKFSYTIYDELGVHARPAGLLAKAANQYDCKIIVKGTEKKADAKSILGIMGLGVKKGDEVTFYFDGTDEKEASETIKALLKEIL